MCQKHHKNQFSWNAFIRENWRQINCICRGPLFRISRTLILNLLLLFVFIGLPCLCLICRWRARLRRHANNIMAHGRTAGGDANQRLSANVSDNDHNVSECMVDYSLTDCKHASIYPHTHLLSDNYIHDEMQWKFRDWWKSWKWRYNLPSRSPVMNKWNHPKGILKSIKRKIYA